MNYRSFPFIHCILPKGSRQVSCRIYLTFFSASLFVQFHQICFVVASQKCNREERKNSGFFETWVKLWLSREFPRWRDFFLMPFWRHGTKLALARSAIICCLFRLTNWPFRCSEIWCNVQQSLWDGNLISFWGCSLVPSFFFLYLDSLLQKCDQRKNLRTQNKIDHFLHCYVI